MLVFGCYSAAPAPPVPPAGSDAVGVTAFYSRGATSRSSISGTLRDARRRNSIWRMKLPHRSHIIRCRLSCRRSSGVSGCSIAREESFEASSHEYISLLMLHPKPVLAHAGTQAQPRSKQYDVQVSRRNSDVLTDFVRRQAHHLAHREHQRVALGHSQAALLIDAPGNWLRRQSGAAIICKDSATSRDYSPSRAAHCSRLSHLSVFLAFQETQK